MSMTMQGEVVLKEQKGRVWDLLNDPAVLKACIPGCELVQKSSDTTYAAVVKVKLGPISARFKGNVELSPTQEPDCYEIAGQGDGGIAGLAKGGAVVTLFAEGEGTRLTYDVEAQVSGRMMQMGSRMINSVMRKLADEFFNNFAAHLAATPIQAN